MKKLFSSVFILFTFCLASCSAPMQSVQTRQNNLDSPFSSKIALTLDKLNAEGTIKRYGDSEWEVEFDSPNTLSGVNLAFSQGNVSASYKGLSFSVPKSALPVKAMLVNLIDAVDTNARSEELKGSDNEGMLEIQGNSDGGDYILTVDGNGNISSFDMPNNLLEISFKEVTAISGGEIPSTNSTTETAVPTETTVQAENNSQAVS